MAHESHTGKSLRPAHQSKDADESWKHSSSRESTHDRGHDAEVDRERRPFENAPGTAETRQARTADGPQDEALQDETLQDGANESQAAHAPPRRPLANE